jgi:hypothetical protein
MSPLSRRRPLALALSIAYVRANGVTPPWSK